MPYSLVPLVDNPDWTPGMHRSQRQRWVGWDAEEGWNGVRLRRDLALAWHPTVTLSHPLSKVLADDGLDVLNPTRRGVLAALAPDRALRAGMRLRDIVGDFLMRQTPGGLPPLLPHRAGRFEILCGPGPKGQNRLWEQATAPDGPHSQDIQDVFTRADSALNGSTSSDSQFTWTLAQGNTTYANVVSNQAKFNNDLSASYFHVLRPSLNMDTLNHYGQADIVSFSGSGAFSYAAEIAVRIRNGDGAVGDEGYSFSIFHDSAPSHSRSVYDWMGSTLPGASDTTNTTSGTIYLEFNGSSYVAKINGATIFSGTDTTYNTYKKVCLVAYCSGSGTPVVVADNYRAADLAVGVVIPVFMNQYRQRGN